MVTRRDAIILASKYRLSSEVKYCMDVLHYPPEEALDDWDIPYDSPEYTL